MSELVNSCLNYSGNKFKLLPQLLPLFPDNFNNFIDLFAGGSVVGINVAEQYKLFNLDSRFILNDKQNEVIHLFKYMNNSKTEDFIQQVEEIISTYNLSNTKKYGYKKYNINSADGLSEYNKKRYIKLRADYNNGKFKDNQKYVMFYVLIVFGFNNQIRFNRKGEYNLPVGKRDFNDNMQNKLINFMEALHNNSFEFHTKDFRKVNYTKKNDFVYADPPYRISTASYNENGGWTKKDDQDLFKYLDNLNNFGVKFALSNVFTHKGQTNDELIKWSEKYNVYFLNIDYNNSNYQSMAKNDITTEVLITNY